MKHSNLKLRFARLAGSVSAVFLLGGIMTSCQDELLTGQPSWLGESIYAELESRGNFTETLKLINAQSEDYASVLKKTGSRTLFVADDAAWARFYQNNPWGVKSLDQMSEAQKRLVFKGNMIKSAYLVELLGNLPAANADSEPEEGACMRRASSVDLMDSVPVILKKDFPAINPIRTEPLTGEQVDYWKRLRGKESALIMQDDAVPTMIHFMPKFMQYNGITSHDVDFLTNHEIKSNTGAFINGKVITEKDVTCQNGYIHVVEDVPVPLDNMANVINNNPNFSIYKRLLDRFSYPQYSRALSEEYERLYGVKDSVYVRRYFNDHGKHNITQLDAIDGGATVNNVLPYDPGWNRFVYESSNNDITFQTDAAVMVVPNDEAMLKYLKTDGNDLYLRYKDAGPGETAWDNAPDEVVLPLLTNTMLKNSTLKSAIPSLFASINNSASESMGVKEDDIDYVHWACNGVVYETHKVYVAPEYVSVFYPCVIRATEDLRMAYTVVNNDRKVQGGEGFYAYLNNMGSKYTYVIPTDNALQNYFDPVTYKRTAQNGESTAVQYKFYVSDDGKIAARPYLVDWTNLDGKGWGLVSETVAQNVTISNESSAGASAGDAFNHFKDIIYSSLAVGLFTPGQRFYASKNGSPIVVKWDGDQVVGVAGSFQYERGYYIPVTEIFDKSAQGNGISYIVDDEPLMSTFLSPFAALTDPEKYDQFGSFASLMEGMDAVSTTDDSGKATMDKALKMLNNGHYTIYVPTNDGIDELIESKKLPTWDDVSDVEDCINNADLSEEDEAYLTEQLQIMKDVINNFVSYHIQDNSIYVDGEDHNNDVYESQCLDTTTNRFVKLYVNYRLGGNLTVIDNAGNTRTVDPEMNNILTRQYFFNGSSLTGNSCTQINSSSYAVIHQINAPLFPNNHSLYDPAEFEKVMKILAENPVDGSGSEDNAKTTKRRK